MQIQALLDKYHSKFLKRPDTGKIMSIVSIVDEILASMGTDGIDLVLEQYRSIGLKSEEERLMQQ